MSHSDTHLFGGGLLGYDYLWQGISLQYGFGLVQI